MRACQRLAHPARLRKPRVTPVCSNCCQWMFFDWHQRATWRSRAYDQAAPVSWWLSRCVKATSPCSWASTATAGPTRTSSGKPRSARAVRSSVRQASAKSTWLASQSGLLSHSGSMTNTASASGCARAATKGAWSCTRRSRLNHTSARCCAKLPTPMAAYGWHGDVNKRHHAALHAWYGVRPPGSATFGKTMA